MNSFVFSCFNGSVTGVHRNLSTMMSLTEALASVGYKKTSSLPFNSNSDLETSLADNERPRIKVVDYFYGLSAGANGLGIDSYLTNVDQLVFSRFQDGDANTV